MLTTAELFARRQLKLAEKKETIAEISTLVIENPEENVCSQCVSDCKIANYLDGEKCM